MLKRLAEWVGRYPKTVVGIVIALTVFFGYGLTKIEMVTDVKKMLPEGDPRLKAFDEVDKTFGGADFIMVALSADDVFEYATILKIDKLTRDFEKIKGVGTVSSITNIEEIKGVEGGIELVELIEDIPSNKEDLKELKVRVMSDKDYVGNIVSKDGKAAVIIVQVQTNADKSQVIRDLKEAIRKLSNNPDKDGKVYLMGLPVHSDERDKSIGRDMRVLFPLAILVVIAILFLSFLSLRGVILPLLIVVITVIWTIGLMGFLSIPLAMISNVMPIIIVSLGVADGIHILTRYREELFLGFGKRESLTKTISAVGLACLLTSITTAVGFASLCFSTIRPIREFGLATAIGVGIAFVITVTLFLAILFLLPPPKKLESRKQDACATAGLTLRLSSKLLSRWAALVIGNPKKVLAIALFLSLLAIVAIPLISTDMDYMHFFKQDNPIRIADDFIKEKFGGAEVIQVVVKGDIKAPNVLSSMERLASEMEKIEILGKPMSIVNLLKDTNRALHEDDARFEVVPSKEEEVAQYLLLLSLGGGDALDNLISFDYSQALIQARVRSTSSAAQDEMVKEVKKAIEKSFDDSVQVTLTGMPVLTRVMDNLLVKGQLQSLAFAILSIFILMVIISRSLTYGMFCTVPIAFTVLLNFGVMGAFGVHLDVATAMTASLAIGIGVDYAIHFFSRYREERNGGKGAEDALKIATTTTGEAILYNAAAVGVGFLVFVFSTDRRGNPEKRG